MTDKTQQYLFPEWPAPPAVRAVMTTRQFGEKAENNWEQLKKDFGFTQTPVFLKQIHGAQAVDLDHPCENYFPADACHTRSPQKICLVYTADCLPILLCDQKGMEVAAIHAGWRGLLAGVIGNTVCALKTPAPQLLAWLGPAIGPDHFEVNADIRKDYIARYPAFAEGFFQPSPSAWFADLYKLARLDLQQCGVQNISGGGYCTYCDADRFYSYRRDKNLKESQRMSALIWLENRL